MSASVRFSLDLICSVGIDKVCVQGLRVGISEKPQIKSTISYRDMRNISTEHFSTASAASSSLSLSVNLSCPGEILLLYNDATSTVTKHQGL